MGYEWDGEGRKFKRVKNKRAEAFQLSWGRRDTAQQTDEKWLDTASRARNHRSQETRGVAKEKSEKIQEQGRWSMEGTSHRLTEVLSGQDKTR